MFMNIIIVSLYVKIFFIKSYMSMGKYLRSLTLGEDKKRFDGLLMYILL